jgi:hypothetical protein
VCVSIVQWTLSFATPYLEGSKASLPINREPDNPCRSVRDAHSRALFSDISILVGGANRHPLSPYLWGQLGALKASNNQNRTRLTGEDANFARRPSSLGSDY